MRQHIAILAASLAMLLASAPAPALLDLTEAQQTLLDKASGLLDRLETNLNLAISTVPAGTDKPTGSKARLAKMRLDQAKASIPPAEEALKGLPADDSSVQSAQARLDSAKAKAQAFDDRLAGKGAAPKADPKPAPDGSPDTATEPAETKPASETVRLDYKQVDLVKGARFNLNQVDGYNKALYELMNQIQGVENKDTVDHRKLIQALETISEAKRKAGFAADALAPLPANGEGVAEQATRLEAARASTAAAEQYLTPIHTRLQQVINPANYPNYRADLERIRGLSQMFGNLAVFQYDRPLAAETFKQGPAAKEEIIRIAQTYQFLMIQQTHEGKQIEGAGNSMFGSYKDFFAAAEQEKATLPDQIRSDLSAANAQADQAVAEKKPLYFSGGIPQRIGWADDKFTLYQALDPEGAPALGKEIEQFKANINERQKALTDLIIEQNKLPQDKYAGADKKALAKRAVDTWLEIQPKAKVLKVVMPIESWKRSTKWTYSNGTWYFSDTSKLQVKVIVKHDNKLAVIRPINLWIDHTTGDALSATSFYTLEDELQPSNFLLLKNAK